MFSFKKYIFKATAFFLLSSIAYSGTPGVNKSACSRAFKTFVADLGLVFSKEQSSFINDVFLPVVGKRGLYDELGVARKCKTNKKCVYFPPSEGSTAQEVRFEWSNSALEPEIQSSDRQVKLIIPENFDWSSFKDRGAGLIKRLLISSDMHPHTVPRSGNNVSTKRQSLGEPPILLKRTQVDAIEALNAAIDRGDKSFLFVAPTGTGKTEVLKAALTKLFSVHSDTNKKLYFIIADQNFLVTQLYDDIAKITDTEFELKQWGGEGEPAVPMSDLLFEADQSDKPILVVTTIDSLSLPRVDALSEQTADQLKEQTAAVFYDEAHHTGGDTTSDFLLKFTELADAFLYGTTATPVHALRSIIDQIFGGRAFWAYVDTKETYFGRDPSTYHRGVEVIVDQLFNAIEAGELAGFDKIYFLDPEQILGDGRSLFRAAGFRKVQINDTDHQYKLFEIDPEHYETVAKTLLPLIDQHQKGFISTRTIKEAEAMADHLNALSTKRRFESWHSELSSAQKKSVVERFRSGEINFLVTCTKLDEGINFPDMTLYVDLNKALGPRQFLQRIGRVLRILEGKSRVEIVTFSELDAGNVKVMLDLLDRMLQDKLVVPIKGDDNEDDNDAIAGPDGQKMTREEYDEYLKLLRDSMREFWNETVKNQRSNIDLINLVVASTGELPKKAGGIVEGSSYGQGPYQKVTKLLSETEEKLKNLGLTEQTIALILEKAEKGKTAEVPNDSIEIINEVVRTTGELPKKSGGNVNEVNFGQGPYRKVNILKNQSLESLKASGLSQKAIELILKFQDRPMSYIEIINATVAKTKKLPNKHGGSINGQSYGVGPHKKVIKLRQLPAEKIKTLGLSDKAIALIQNKETQQTRDIRLINSIVDETGELPKKAGGKLKSGISYKAKLYRNLTRIRKLSENELQSLGVSKKSIDLMKTQKTVRSSRLVNQTVDKKTMRNIKLINQIVEETGELPTYSGGTLKSGTSYSQGPWVKMRILLKHTHAQLRSSGLSDLAIQLILNEKKKNKTKSGSE